MGILGRLIQAFVGAGQGMRTLFPPLVARGQEHPDRHCRDREGNSGPGSKGTQATCVCAPFLVYFREEPIVPGWHLVIVLCHLDRLTGYIQDLENQGWCNGKVLGGQGAGPGHQTKAETGLTACLWVVVPTSVQSVILWASVTSGERAGESGKPSSSEFLEQ